MDSQSSQTLEYQRCNGQGDAGRRPAPNCSHSILAGRWGCTGAGIVTDTNNCAELSSKLIGFGRLKFYDNIMTENVQIYFKESNDKILNIPINKVKCHSLKNESSVCGRNGNYFFAVLTVSWAYQVRFTAGKPR
jgi:hypothetical protein